LAQMTLVKVSAGEKAPAWELSEEARAESWKPQRFWPVSASWMTMCCLAPGV